MFLKKILCHISLVLLRPISPAARGPPLALVFCFLGEWTVPLRFGTLQISHTKHRLFTQWQVYQSRTWNSYRLDFNHTFTDLMKSKILNLSRWKTLNEVWNSFFKICNYSGLYSIFQSGVTGSHESYVALGDDQGHLHVLLLPKNLSKPLSKEKITLERILTRQEQNIVDFQRGRRSELVAFKENLEKSRGVADLEDEQFEVFDSGAEESKAVDLDYTVLMNQFSSSSGLTNWSLLLLYD